MAIAGAGVYEHPPTPPHLHLLLFPSAPSNAAPVDNYERHQTCLSACRNVIWQLDLTSSINNQHTTYDLIGCLCAL